MVIVKREPHKGLGGSQEIRQGAELAGRGTDADARVGAGASTCTATAARLGAPMGRTAFWNAIRERDAVLARRLSNDLHRRVGGRLF